MTPETCIVPTFDREELLFVCLESIRRSDPEIPITVYSDRGAYSVDLNAACDTFGARLRIRRKHSFYGNSYNVMEALGSALHEAWGIVHLIEDDTVVRKDWFQWARRALVLRMNAAEGSYYACAYAHRSADDQRTDWYESPCVAWDAVHLGDALRMMPKNYYAETREGMQTALDRQFPNSRQRGNGCEQDSFFLRCVEHFGWVTKHPERPLASHLGWYGYNRPADGIRPMGTIEERIAAVRAFEADSTARMKAFGDRITKLELEGMAN